MSQILENALVPSGAVVEHFKQLANDGNWFDQLLMWVANALYGTEETGELLSELLEDALIAFGIYKLGTDPIHQEEVRILIPLTEQSILKLAIQERLPRVGEKEAQTLSEMLVQDLIEKLRAGTEIPIDDGLVIFNHSEDCPEIRIVRGKGTF